MNAATALLKVKRRLNVPSGTTTWDTEIAEFIVDAVDRLFPVLGEDKAEQEVSLASSVTTIDLTAYTSLHEVKALYVKQAGSGDEDYQGFSDWYTHRRKIYLQNPFGTSMTVKIVASGPYAIDDLPVWANLVVVYWALAEFYEFLLGDKRKYNQYMESSGARSVDNMANMADRYEDKGNRILMDRVGIEGL